MINTTLVSYDDKNYAAVASDPYKNIDYRFHIWGTRWYVEERHYYEVTGEFYFYKRG